MSIKLFGLRRLYNSISSFLPFQPTFNSIEKSIHVPFFDFLQISFFLLRFMLVPFFYNYFIAIVSTWLKGTQLRKVSSRRND